MRRIGIGKHSVRGYSSVPDCSSEYDDAACDSATALEELSATDGPGESSLLPEAPRTCRDPSGCENVNHNRQHPKSIPEKPEFCNWVFGPLITYLPNPEARVCRSTLNLHLVGRLFAGLASRGLASQRGLALPVATWRFMGSYK